MLCQRKKLIVCLLAAVMLLSVTGCCSNQKNTQAAQAETTAVSSDYGVVHTIVLSQDSAALDGQKVEAYDYTWHCDPSVSHDDVKNAPAEYYTGTAPDTNAAVYIDHELYYYPALDESLFQLVNYDGEPEWAYYYTDGAHDDYIFATLPRLGNAFPAQMMHTETEAAANQVLHITQPGTFMLEGSWKGQVWVDLGEKDSTFTDPNAKVTLILNNADIECSAAPGIVFYSAYECDNTWESKGEYNADVDTSNAGVTVVLASGSENRVSGTNVFRMLKTAYKDSDAAEEIKLQKKQRKIDAAFYSFVTMNIEGDGALEINSGFEGLDSELHLTVRAGNITINSQDDGINVNEDHVSVVNFCGGNVTLHAALGAEGDGVDSNGYIAIRGGRLSIDGITAPDNALDSEDGIYYDCGTVTIDGTEQSYAAGSVFRESGSMGEKEPFGDRTAFPETMQGGENFDLNEFKEKVAALPDDATFNDVLALLGMAGMRGTMPDEEGRQPDAVPPQGGMPQDGMPQPGQMLPEDRP